MADNNGQHLIASRLHSDDNVIIYICHTIMDAIRNIPNLDENEVTDIVLLYGLNNIITPSAKIDETMKLFDDAYWEYRVRFPSAVIYVGSVAPSLKKTICFNAELKRLASARHAVFISARCMLKRTAQGLETKNVLLDGIHLTKKGTRFLAREIKRCFYRNASKIWQNHPLVRISNLKQVSIQFQFPTLPLSLSLSLSQSHSHSHSLSLSLSFSLFRFSITCDCTPQKPNIDVYEKSIRNHSNESLRNESFMLFPPFRLNTL